MFNIYMHNMMTEQYVTAFTITGPDRTYHASRFIFSSFFFNVSVCSVW